MRELMRVMAFLKHLRGGEEDQLDFNEEDILMDLSEAISCLESVFGRLADLSSSIQAMQIDFSEALERIHIEATGDALDINKRTTKEPK